MIPSALDKEDTYSVLIPLKEKPLIHPASDPSSLIIILMAFQNSSFKSGSARAHTARMNKPNSAQPEYQWGRRIQSQTVLAKTSETSPDVSMAWRFYPLQNTCERIPSKWSNPRISQSCTNCMKNTSRKLDTKLEAFVSRLPNSSQWPWSDYICIRQITKSLTILLKTQLFIIPV